MKKEISGGRGALQRYASDLGDTEIDQMLSLMQKPVEFAKVLDVRFGPARKTNQTKNRQKRCGK